MIFGIRKQMLVLVSLGTEAIKPGLCTLCESDTSDIVKHLICNCYKLLEIQNNLYYRIVDILPVQESVLFFEQDDDDILVPYLAELQTSDTRSTR